MAEPAPSTPPSWLPTPRVVTVPGRGEVFCRVHEHDGAPALLLLHGWTATADVQFAAAYRALMERYSFVAVDHRGHGRGIRGSEPFRLEDVADDAAGVVRELGCGPVVAVGFSMGGPLALHLADRHPDVVRGLVLEATALSFTTNRVDRFLWRLLAALETMMRSRLGGRWARGQLERLALAAPAMQPLVPWLAGEMSRGDPRALAQAGRALRHFDGEPIASRLRLPAVVVVTTRDRSVRPADQYRLARALDAAVVELEGGHFCSLQLPEAFAERTVTAIDRVVFGQNPAHSAGI